MDSRTLADMDDDLEDLLPDELAAKGDALPLTRTPKQIEAARKAAERRQAADDLRAAQDAAKAHAAQLAQIVNLHIAGHSLADIGASIGASAAEVDRMLNAETQRYVRTQPALRTYVRNWISEKYAKMIEADWDEAVDKNSSVKLENQDRVLRILDKMSKLHGADAPTQTEIKVEAAPEAVEKLVSALASTHGLGYDMDIFDAEVVSDVVEESHRALEAAHDAVEDSDGEDDL